MRDNWTDRLSDYLDGGMTPVERARIEERLRSDPELRDLLEELRAVKAAAANLPIRPPPRDLWPEIEGRLRQSGATVPADNRRRRFSFTVPQLVAASVAFVLLGSGAVWLGLKVQGTGAGSYGVVQEPAQPGASLVAAGDRTAPSYEAAIRELELGLAVGRELLDSVTVRTLEESLSTIDRAIAQAENALKADPANAYLNRHLADAKTRKLALLRQASVLAGT